MFTRILPTKILCSKQLMLNYEQPQKISTRMHVKNFLLVDSFEDIKINFIFWYLFHRIKLNIMLLPLTHKDNRSFSYKVRNKLHDWKRLIFSDKNSRNLFLFLLLNLSFAFVELTYGIITNSLGKFF